VIENERNFGLVGNWNRCIKLAQGEWLKFVFQDDLIHDECLAAMVRATQPADKFVACRREILVEDRDEELEKKFEQFRCRISMDGVFPGELGSDLGNFVKECSLSLG